VYCVDAIEQLIEHEGPQTVAAVIAEPISASGGIAIPPPEYLPRLRQICDRHGVLLIVDEVITGFGRTGKMFASEHWDLVGDIMTMAKGLSSGYAPIAAAICRPKIVEPFASETGKRLSHLLTFGGQAVACAAALANIAILQRERLVDNAATMGAYLLEQLQGLRHHPTIGDIRGLGLLVAVELVKNRTTKEKFSMEGEEVKTLNQLLLDRSLLTRATHMIMLAPPLCITRAEVDRIVEIIDSSLTALEQQYGYR
jgi:adenosylmethionine-8-amino-7-oxononanoate aminotransferase